MGASSLSVAGLGEAEVGMLLDVGREGIRSTLSILSIRPRVGCLLAFVRDSPPK